MASEHDGVSGFNPRGYACIRVSRPLKAASTFIMCVPYEPTEFELWRSEAG
jgi:hypothetical protein